MDSSIQNVQTRVMLSREQENAKLFDRHIAVNANAGSGKTTVLVKRYIDILEQGYDINKIVAITFTRKAAAEMKSSIIHELREIIDSPDREKKLSVYDYKKLREKILYARITTIHSFCSSLLKDNPIDVDLSPNFGEISPFDLSEIRSEAINDVISAWSYNEDLKPKLDMIIDAFGIKTLVKSLLPEMLLNSDKSNAAIDAYDKFDINKIVNEHFDEYLNKQFNQFHIIIEEFFHTFTPEEKHIEKFQEAKSDFESISNDIPIYEKIADIFKILVVKLGRKGIKGSIIDLFPQFDEITKTLQYIHKNFTNSDDNTSEYLEIGILLKKMYREILEEIDDRKKALNSIDFDDMIIKANELLNDDTVLKKVREEIDFLMVDEFQDTNQVQYEIVEKLTNGLKNNIFDTDCNLFIVGDYKQSIYAFRSADVRVYKKAIDKIENTNSHGIKTKRITTKENLSNEENCGLIKFNASHRMLPNLAVFINDIFNDLMRSTSSNLVGEGSLYKRLKEFETDYDELISSKRSVEAVKELSASNSLGTEFGTINFISTAEDKETAKERKKNNEAEGIDDSNDELRTEEQAIADYIVNAVKRGSLRIKERAANYGDFAILSKRAKNFGDLASEFTKRDVPFIIHSGKGYFQRQEIQDFISMIKFLVDKHDDIALAATLRSPFFTLTDDELLAISCEKGNYFFKKLENFRDKNPENVKIERFFDVIEALQDLTHRSTLSELIFKIAEYTGWYGIIQKYYDGEQKKANLDKLIDEARKFDQRGFKNIVDFIRELNMLSKDENESEASISDSSDAVQIMTIHKSKGLGFNIVILYDIISTGSQSDQFFFDEQYGIAFKKRNIENRAEKDESKQQYLAKLIVNKAEEEEQKRVLYVALTRAKEHLVISVKQDHNHNITGLLKLMADILKLEESDFLTDNIVKKHSKLKFLAENQVHEKDIKYELNIIHADNIQADLKAENIRDENNIKIDMFQDINSNFSGEIYSATKIAAFSQNTSKYVQRFVLGLPELDEKAGDEKDFESNEQILLSASSWGNVVHYAFENITTWIDASLKIDFDKLKNMIRANIEKSEKSYDEDLIDKFVAEINDTLSLPIIRKNLALMLNSDTEITFMLPFSDEILLAQIDMLFKNSDGEFEIWDWKTNKIGNGSVADLAAKYEAQMQFYSLMMMKRYPDQKNYVSRLIFTKAAKDHKENAVHSKVWSPEELLEFESRLKNDIAKIKAHDFSDIF